MQGHTPTSRTWLDSLNDTPWHRVGDVRRDRGEVRECSVDLCPAVSDPSAMSNSSRRASSPLLRARAPMRIKARTSRHGGGAARCRRSAPVRSTSSAVRKRAPSPYHIAVVPHSARKAVDTCPPARCAGSPRRTGSACCMPPSSPPRPPLHPASSTIPASCSALAPLALRSATHK